jgi:copper(I)-binding protein
VLNNTLAVGAATDPIALAAHATVRLEAFGPDVWVFDPAPLHPGSAVPIIVHFRHAAAVTVDAEVRTVLQMAQTGAASTVG